MSEMRVEVRGLERLFRKMDEALAPVRDVIVELVQFADTEVRRNAKPHPGDLGKLSAGANIQHEVSPAGTPLDDVRGRVYSNSPIVAEVDRGRSPGGRRPPIKALARWAGRHGIPEDRAFYLARAIQRKGSEPVEMFEQAKVATEVVAERATGEAAREIERRWRA